MVFTGEENTYMLGLYELSEKTPRIAIELFKEKFGHGPNERTIKKKWKGEGYKLQDRGGLRRGLNPEQYKELHKESGGDLEKMIKKTGFNRQSITSKCRVLGLKLNNT